MWGQVRERAEVDMLSLPHRFNGMVDKQPGAYADADSASHPPTCSLAVGFPWLWATTEV